MLYYLTAYIRFLFASTNQHGVHSPFIYKYITQCLYAKPHYKTSKTTNVVLKSIGYFKATHLLITPDDPRLKSRVLEEYQSVGFTSPTFDIIYVDGKEPKEITTSLLGNNDIHNDTVVLINAIHKNKNANAAWKSLKSIKEVIVTLDLFYCGAVFFRKEQAKQHFKIRI